MKKIKQKTKRKIVLAVCVLAAALVIVLIVQGVRGLFYKKADTSAGLEYIHGEEKGDIAAIEKKIELLEKKELCDKKRIAFIDSSDLMSDEYYEQDGIHFKASFYPVWAEKMAEVAGL